jgi:hypothetical protein
MRSTGIGSKNEAPLPPSTSKAPSGNSTHTAWCEPGKVIWPPVARAR